MRDVNMPQFLLIEFAATDTGVALTDGLTKFLQLMTTMNCLGTLATPAGRIGVMLKVCNAPTLSNPHHIAWDICNMLKDTTSAVYFVDSDRSIIRCHTNTKTAQPFALQNAGHILGITGGKSWDYYREDTQQYYRVTK